MCVLGILLALIERNTSVSQGQDVVLEHVVWLATRPSGGRCHGENHSNTISVSYCCGRWRVLPI